VLDGKSEHGVPRFWGILHGVGENQETQSQDSHEASTQEEAINCQVEGKRSGACGRATLLHVRQAAASTFLFPGVYIKLPGVPMCGLLLPGHRPLAAPLGASCVREDPLAGRAYVRPIGLSEAATPHTCPAARLPRRRAGRRVSDGLGLAEC
jgi:hypothetical protein